MEEHSRFLQTGGELIVGAVDQEAPDRRKY
jgi:hypothetical protein